MRRCFGLGRIGVVVASLAHRAWRRGPFAFRPGAPKNSGKEVSSLAHQHSVCYILLQQTRFGPHMANEKNDSPRTVSKGFPQSRRDRAPLFAAVDLGTNNCRLLIAAPRGGSFKVVDSYSQIVRLGEGLNESGRISDQAMSRAVEALGKIAAKLKARNVRHVRCVATQACRQASNGADFIRSVKQRTQLDFKIIGAEEEARLALIGCHDLIAPESNFVCVLDIGGGSTEVSFVDSSAAQAGGLPGLLRKPPIKLWTSLPIGVVTLTEAFAHLDEADAIHGMRAMAKDYVAGWSGGLDVQKAFAHSQAHLIGTSGTITCLAGVHLGLARYRRDLVDGMWVDHQDMLEVIERLRAAGPVERKNFPTIGAERAGLMLAGCAIVEAVWQLAPDARMRVADRGLREGLLLSMMNHSKRRRRRRRRKPTDQSAKAENKMQAANVG